MKNSLVPAGLLFNSAIITIDRFLLPIPDLPYILCMLLGIALILAGIIKSK